MAALIEEVDAKRLSNQLEKSATAAKEAKPITSTAARFVTQAGEIEIVKRPTKPSLMKPGG